MLYTLSCSCTSLPVQGGGGALRFGLIGPSCTSPTVLLSGLKVTFSLGSSENPGREGDVGLVTWLEFLNDSCMGWLGGTGTDVSNKGEIAAKITQIKYKVKY